MTTRTLTCEEFSDGLGDYIDETSGAAARAAMDAHAATCDACAALLSDVRSLVAEARVLPELAPSRDLWQGIEARIAAPVIALDSATTRVGSGARARRRSFGLGWIAAAAAALVVATAGITFTATKRMYEGGAASPSVAATPAPTSPAGTGSPGTGEPGTRGDALPAPATRVADTSPASPDAAAIRPRPDATAGSGAPSALPVAMTAAEATYDVEIGELRAVLERRRAELDPATVAILEHNLGVIDQAIEQSRAALARDPADRFLTEQLNSTLGRKVELLRTAAMLPARI